jgi:hypothetical protein
MPPSPDRHISPLRLALGHITGGVSAAYRREIESAPDPDAKRAEAAAHAAPWAAGARE